MDNMHNLLEQLKKRHADAAREAYPPTQQVCAFTRELVNCLFPEHNGMILSSPEALTDKIEYLQKQLERLLAGIPAERLHGEASGLAQRFMDGLPEVYRNLTQDAEAIYQGDPAATGLYEVIRAYPGFYAIAFYRIAHVLYRLDIPLLPRIITEFAHARTGIDIHPAATIGPYFCIDHGTGVVIGETTVIGEHVKLYQGVTLGAASVDKLMAKSKRHPTIEDHAVIYSGATILGGETTVGHHSIIGGNVWLIKSVPPNSRIYYRANDVSELI